MSSFINLLVPLLLLIFPNNHDKAKDSSSYYITPDNVGMDTTLSAIEFSQKLGIGWNLGNSLESIKVSNSVYTGNETSWENPVVTQKLIDSVKAAGFSSIRIPVAWSHSIIDQTTFKLSDAWLSRVSEVVNYALKDKLFVIINIHWDGGWMEHPFLSSKEIINKKIEKLWTQIAFYFRDYDDHLIFAGTNEVHVENNWGTPSDENLLVQTTFNQTFVNAVRATGCKNQYRFLVVQAYNTNIELAKNNLSMPKDVVANRLMAEVHFYDPYEFSLKEDLSNVSVWNNSKWGKEDWVDKAFGYMKTKFIDNGIPIILGEYGAVLRSSLTGQALQDHIASRNYYLGYITHAAIQNGMIPFYWDNGNTGNGGFGLFNRKDGTKAHPDAIQAIIEAKNKK